MAQNEQTFLYRLRTIVDDEGAFSELGSVLSQLANKSEQARAKIANMMDEIAKSGPRNAKQLAEVRDAFNRINNATDIQGLKRIREDLVRIQSDMQEGTAEAKQLARVIEAIDTADFKALSEEVNGLKKRIPDAADELVKLQQLLSQVDESSDLEEVDAQIEAIQEEVVRLENQDIITPEQAANMRRRLESAVQSTNELRKAQIRAANAVEQNTNASIEGLGNKADKTRIKTTQMSQEFLRMAQDAQFGMLGMANNMQGVGDAMARARAEGRSMSEVLKASISSLTTGPMAIATVITAVTLLLQNLDKLPEPVKNFVRQLGFANTELEDLAENSEKAAKEITKFTDKDFISLFEDLKNNAEVIQILKQRFDNASEATDKYNTKLRKIRENNWTYNLLLSYITDSLVGYSTNQLKAARATGATIDQTEILIEEFNKLPTIAKFFPIQAVTNATERITEQVDKVRELSETERTLRSALKAANATSIQETKIREKLTRLFPEQASKVNVLAKAIARERRERNKNNEQLKREKLLRTLRIEAMEEGHKKRMAQLRQQFDERERRIKEQTEKGSVERRRMLDLLGQIERDAMKDARKETRVQIAKEQFKTREMEINAMRDGLPKTLRQIELEFEKRRAKLKREFDKESAVRQRRLRALQRQETQAIREARREAIESISVPEVPKPKAFFESGEDEPVRVPIPGQGLVNKEDVEKERKRLKNEWQKTKEEFSRRRQALQEKEEQGTAEGFFGGFSAAQVQFQEKILKKEEKLQKSRVEARKQHLRNLRKNTPYTNPKRRNELKNQINELESKKTSIQEKWQHKREQLQKKHLRQMVNNLESSGLGNATSGLIMNLGKVWKNFFSDKAKWQKKSTSQQAQMLASAGSMVVSSAANIAEQTFATWKQQRSQDLKDEGKTAEERRKILKKEGKKRFQMMKAMKYASALASGLEAQVYAWTEGFKNGGWPAAVALSAASAVKTGFLLKKISQLSIGDRIGGSASGGGRPSGKFTQLNQNRSARRAADFGSQAQQNSTTNNQDPINKAADKMNEAAQKTERAARSIENQKVQYDDKTAEDINTRGQNQSNRLNV